MIRRSTTLELIKKVLTGDYTHLEIQSYQLREEVVTGGQCTVSVRLRNTRTGQFSDIEGSGVGFIDALYHGLMDHYAREFESLETLQFTGFDVTAKMETTRDKKGLDAVAAVALTVLNSERRAFEFEQEGRSLVAAGLAVVVEAVEFFVNSERAFITVYRALCDARERHRADLVQSYTTQLSELVSTTSYTRIIEHIKEEEL